MLTLQRSSTNQNPKALSAALHCFLLGFKIWLPFGRIGYRNKIHKQLSTNQAFSMVMFYLISYLFLHSLKWIHESVWFRFKIRQLRWLWVLLFLCFVCLFAFCYFCLFPRFAYLFYSNLPKSSKGPAVPNSPS